VHAAVEAGVGLPTVAAMTADGGVVRKCCGIDDQGSTVGENCATASGSAITRVMRAKAKRAKGVTSLSACRSCQMECGVSYLRVTESV
jgi:hypothetical protein